MEKSFEERVAEARARVPALTAQQANAHKQQQPEVIFIDPRDAADIQSTTGIIPQALNIRLFDLSKTTDSELPAALSDRTRTIITACQGGPMGALAAYALKQRGYKNVHFIEGGTQAWLDAGYPTVR
jgi:rhodanese-related sulfurtransferase